MNSPGWLKPTSVFWVQSQGVWILPPFFLSKVFFILCCFCGKNGAQKSLGSDPWRVTQLPGTDPWSISKDFRSLWIMAFTFLGPMVHVRSTWKAKAMPITWKTKRLWSMCTVGRHTFWIFWWVFFWKFGHVLKNQIPENSHKMLSFKKTHVFFQGFSPAKNRKSHKSQKKTQTTWRLNLRGRPDTTGLSRNLSLEQQWTTLWERCGFGNALAPTKLESRWWFQIFFIFTTTWGRWTHFDDHIFQMGWKHQLGMWAFSIGTLGPEEIETNDFHGRMSWEQNDFTRRKFRTVFFFGSEESVDLAIFVVFFLLKLCKLNVTNFFSLYQNSKEKKHGRLSRSNYTCKDII